MRNNLLLITLFLIALTLFTLNGENKKQKVVQAHRTEEHIKLDGLLTEKVWQEKGYTNFTQSEPKDGEPATEKTLVWVAFDDSAIYAAARLFDSKPGKIDRRLARRDNFIKSDWFIFYLDPYYDRRSGFQVGVNAAGSIADWTIFNDEFRDPNWDGIWEYGVHVDDKGWTVEIKIPFDQLRFKKKKNGGDYIWGVNFRRYHHRKNEVSTYSWAAKEESGMASHFARLEGIRGINPRRLIDLLPYTIAKASFSPQEKGNPFETGKDLSANMGIDLKVGLKNNLTLDLTVNPDFGQVEVDPAVINLTAAESYYSEKRPFFIEGSSIFRFGIGGSTMNIGAHWADPRFFYSRRIGRPPQGYTDTDGHVDYPDWATILTAAKITGKVGKGWNLGLLGALTQREYADIDLDETRYKEEVEPFSSFCVLRTQKEFNQGKQGLGFISTAVLRDLRTESLESLLNREAFSLAIDGWTFFGKEKTWVITGWLGGTHVSGSKEKIWDLQHSYPHYFQRPDSSHVHLDEEATSMEGWAGRFSLNKQKGNFLVNAALGFISPGFDSTDMGFQWDSDVINAHIMLGYRWFKPGKFIRDWSVSLITQRDYDFSGNKIGEQRLIFIANARLLNYWGAYFQLSHNPQRWDKNLTRGGPMAIKPTFTWADWGIFSDRRKSLVLSFDGYLSRSEAGSERTSFGLNVQWKPSSNISISLRPSYGYSHDMAQWVTAAEDEFMTETYGSRYIFGNIRQKTLSCSIRINWIFTPKLSLQAYIQPFIAVGDYYNYKELARSRSFDFNIFGEKRSTIFYEDEVYTADPDGTGNAPAFSFDNPDFNYKSLRGTVVLRWEYKPGSTLYAVWTQNRSDYENPGDFRFGRDFRNLIKAPGDNIFMIKLTYRLKL